MTSSHFRIFLENFNFPLRELLTPLVYLHELYKANGNIIKTKLITQSKAKK